MKKKIITFDQSAKKDILDIFDKAIDKEGFIIEKKGTRERVLSPTGDEVEASKLAGIKRGSLLFFKSDLPSLIELADRIK